MAGRLEALVLALAAAVCAEEVAPGVRYYERQLLRGASPVRLQVLEVDPRHPAVNLLPVRALDRAMGRETISSMVKRYGAVAGVNGGYFLVSGANAGASAGAYQLGGEVLSGGTGRSALVFCRERDFVERAEIDVVSFLGTVKAPDGSAWKLVGVNQPRTEHALVLYRPVFGPSTMTSGPGIEVTLGPQGQVIGMQDGLGNSAIPPDGEVLSAHGAAAAWLRAHVGKIMTATVELRPARTLEKSGCSPEDIIAGGPRLVSGGRVNVTAERFAHAAVRHPRTAFAATRRGSFLFVTVDGRQLSSVGLRLDELAAELVALGAVEALNLDGGGSSTMVVRGAIRNSPSDRSERPVGDGILVFSVPDRGALLELMKRLAPADLLAPLSGKLEAGDRKAFARIIDAEEGRRLSRSAARLLREALAGLRALPPKGL